MKAKTIAKSFQCPCIGHLTSLQKYGMGTPGINRARIMKLSKWHVFKFLKYCKNGYYLEEIALQTQTIHGTSLFVFFQVKQMYIEPL